MSSRRRVGGLGGLVAALVVGAGPLVPAPPGAAAVLAPAPEWSHEEVPPAAVPHDESLSAVFPDGTLVVVWRQVDPGPERPVGVVLRSTRAPGGTWTHPTTFPVPDVARVSAVAVRPGGALEIAYGDAALTQQAEQVRTWHADGSVGDVLLRSEHAFHLDSDPDGDVVATRLGRYANESFDRVVRYRVEDGWQRLPSLRAGRGDVYRPGPGDSVWMAGYDEQRTRLDVRRWTPGQGWKVEWRRDFDRAPQYKSFVVGVDLALGGAGKAVLAWQQRPTRERGSSMRAVRREGRSGWARPLVLEQRSAEDREPMSAPVVAAAGEHAVVAWSTPASIPRLRSVKAAWLTEDGRDLRSLAVTGFFGGSRDLSLDVDLRADGDLLLTYLQRRGHRRQVMAWVGPWLQLTPSLLLRDARVMRGDSADLVPGLASVVATTGDGRLVSFTQER